METLRKFSKQINPIKSVKWTETIESMKVGDYFTAEFLYENSLRNLSVRLKRDKNIIIKVNKTREGLTVTRER